MAGFHWKQGKQFLLTKLINYAKLLEQQTQQSSHVEHKGQKSGGDCISVMHVYPKAHDETVPYPPSQYESFVFRNTVDMRNVLYISLALERFVYYQQEPQNYEASAGLECACIHNNRTMKQWKPHRIRSLTSHVRELQTKQFCKIWILHAWPMHALKFLKGCEQNSIMI